MAYYEQLGDEYVVCSYFGNEEIPGSLPSQQIQEGIITGIVFFKSQNAKVFKVLDGHIILIPESAIVPPEIAQQIHRIVALSFFAKEKSRLYPFEQLHASSSHELINLGLSRNFLYGSFFVLNIAAITNTATTLCPHAIPDLIRIELRSIVLSILGVSGHALGLKGSAFFCVFYSHDVIDVELIATQLTRTLFRSIHSKDADSSLSGAWCSAKLSDASSEIKLSSFIDSVLLRY